MIDDWSMVGVLRRAKWYEWRDVTDVTRDTQELFIFTRIEKYNVQEYYVSRSFFSIFVVCVMFPAILNRTWTMDTIQGAMRVHTRTFARSPMTIRMMPMFKRIIPRSIMIVSMV